MLDSQSSSCSMKAYFDCILNVDVDIKFRIIQIVYSFARVFKRHNVIRILCRRYGQVDVQTKIRCYFNKYLLRFFLWKWTPLHGKSWMAIPILLCHELFVLVAFLYRRSFSFNDILMKCSFSTIKAVLHWLYPAFVCFRASFYYYLNGYGCFYHSFFVMVFFFCRSEHKNENNEIGISHFRAVGETLMIIWWCKIRESINHIAFDWKKNSKKYRQIMHIMCIFGANFMRNFFHFVVVLFDFYFVIYLHTL